MKHYYINNNNETVIIESPLLDKAWQAYKDSGECSVMDDCGIYDVEYCPIMKDIAGDDLSVYGNAIEETA